MRQELPVLEADSCSEWEGRRLLVPLGSAILGAVPPGGTGKGEVLRSSWRS